MHSSQPRKTLTLFLCLILLTCSSVAIAADHLFNGNWGYEQTCGPQHVASVQLSQKGDQVTGKWSDGSTRGSGTSGLLKGSSKNNKLFVLYCGDDENSDSNVCPDYDAETSDYFTRQGKDLIWYKPSSAGKKGAYGKYLVLHPSVNGKPTSRDTHCGDK
jgi:hypothetical protein